MPNDVGLKWHGALARTLVESSPSLRVPLVAYALRDKGPGSYVRANEVFSLTTRLCLRVRTRAAAVMSPMRSALEVNEVPSTRSGASPAGESWWVVGQCWQVECPASRGRP